MLVKQEVVGETDKVVIKHVTYQRENTANLSVEDTLRHIAVIMRKSQNPLFKIVIERSKNIEYIQEVLEKKNG